MNTTMTMTMTTTIAPYVIQIGDDIIEYVSNILIENPKIFIIFSSVNKDTYELTKNKYKMVKEKYYLDIFNIKFRLYEDYSNIVIMMDLMENEDEDPEYETRTDEYFDKIYKKYYMIHSKYTFEHQELTFDDLDVKYKELETYLLSIGDINKSIQDIIVKKMEDTIKYYEIENELEYENYTIKAANNYIIEHLLEIINKCK